MKRKILLGLLLALMASVGFIGHTYAAENTIKPRIIIGPDDRELVSGEHLEQAPYRWTVFLDITFADGSQTYASGAMVSKDTVLTCGHVLFNSSKGWATDVKVHAGFDGLNNKYYAEAAQILGAASWTKITSFNSSYDLAAIKLDRNLGEETGWFPLQQNISLQESVTLTGYPGEKNKTMWTGKGSVNQIYYNGITYSADSTGGNSGSPVYNINNELIAIHSGGVNTSNNGGSKITNTAKQMIDFWVTGQAEVEVTDVSLSNQLLSLEKDQTHQLSVNVLPSNATIKEGKWTTSDKSIATVDYAGKVTGKNHGQTTITFTTDDNRKQATCLVNVVDENYVPLERIEFSNNDQVEDVEKGRSFSTRPPIFIPENASNKEIYYTSSDTDILDMELKDPYSPKYRKSGSVDIYCHSKDNGQTYKAKTVRVDDHGDKFETATQIESSVSQWGYFYKYSDLDYFKFKAESSGEYTIDGEVLGPNNVALNQVWEFMIWDENGTYLKKEEQKYFSYSFEAGKSYYILPKLRRFYHIDEEAYKTNYVLNIFPKGSEKPKNITNITLNKNQLELDEGTSEVLQTTITPADTTDDKTIGWSSSDESVATVMNGEVIGISEGTAIITARTSNGLTATCELRVNEAIIPLERIELSTEFKEVYVGNDRKVRTQVKFYPENATDKTLVWHSSDESILTVSETGVVEALSEGTATITATSGSVSAEIDFDAVDHPQIIEINQEIAAGEVYEEEFQLPDGEIGRGFNRLSFYYETDTGGGVYGKYPWVTISDTTFPYSIYNGDHRNFRCSTYVFPNSTLKIRVVNLNQYYKCELRFELEVCPLNDRIPQPLSTQNLLDELPENEENILENNFVSQ
ncbi:Ig-like domain-containing protein [Enterococcus pallens]|uniref:Serine protease n=1 Tax=Enterococcus pallens ATCC BAA-351 TaxID=1158607 RepID=R2T576_9ENTE|nr:Ig-like domain-containing protein [Enterococcus pallens]EOH95389.1 hypothetical protein UAU_01351 [Enterococcus pallens ATCC BAA-351]EOU21474.1 hypothetical protein I588_02321 [Enterococcus pallens ATCC BAA-351]